MPDVADRDLGARDVVDRILGAVDVVDRDLGAGDVVEMNAGAVADMNVGAGADEAGVDEDRDVSPVKLMDVGSSSNNGGTRLCMLSALTVVTVTMPNTTDTEECLAETVTGSAPSV